MSAFKCAICFDTFEVNVTVDKSDEEIEMQNRWGEDYELEDCEPICPKCFALFFEDDND